MELTCQKEGSLLFVKAAEEARGYVESLPESNTPFPVGRARFHKNNVQTTKGSRSSHHHRLLRPLSELSDCTWYLCIGVSKSVSKEGSIWFCGRCWHINVWRRGSRILSLRHGLEPSGVALYRAFSTTTGEVETFCTTMRLTMNFIDGNTPCRWYDGGKGHGVGRYV